MNTAPMNLMPWKRNPRLACDMCGKRATFAVYTQDRTFSGFTCDACRDDLAGRFFRMNAALTAPEGEDSEPGDVVMPWSPDPAAFTPIRWTWAQWRWVQRKRLGLRVATVGGLLSRLGANRSTRKREREVRVRRERWPDLFIEGKPTWREVTDDVDFDDDFADED